MLGGGGWQAPVCGRLSCSSEVWVQVCTGTLCCLRLLLLFFMLLLLL